jgi:glycosyltransferase involved in cell wall biosynthesis
MIHLLTRGLVERGAEVTLFASGDSETTAALSSVVGTATQDDPGSNSYREREYDLRNVAEAYARAEEFDVLHAHWPTPAAYFSDRTDRPTLLTLDYIERPTFEYYRERYPSLHFACVSRSQAKMLGADLPVVLNGIDVDAIAFGPSPLGFLLTVGRLVPTKGADVAIRVARRVGLPLVIVGDVTPYLPESRSYYETAIAPSIDRDRVHYYPRLSNRRVLELMGQADVFLFPISWEEPFGLVVAEAMAAGTPVVATPRGAMPELIEPGLTGFLAESEDDLVRAVQQARALDRAACRRFARQRFSHQRMAESYESLYRRLRRSGTGTERGHLRPAS